MKKKFTQKQLLTYTANRQTSLIVDPALVPGCSVVGSDAFRVNAGADSGSTSENGVCGDCVTQSGLNFHLRPFIIRGC